MSISKVFNDILREIYGVPTKPLSVIAQERGELSEVEQLVFETEITEYHEYCKNNKFESLTAYKDNPFLKMIPKDAFKGVAIKVPIE